jgi:hypothetical protein
MTTAFLCFWEFYEGILFGILGKATPFMALVSATRRQPWDIWSDLFVETEVFAETVCLGLGFKLRQKFDSCARGETFLQISVPTKKG